MNLVVLLGNLTHDPETRQTAKGNVTRFRIAINRAGKGSEADYFTCVCFGKTADVAAQYLAKGRKVCIEGRLQNTSWEKDGTKYNGNEVLVNRLELVGGGQGAQNSGGQGSGGWQQTPATAKEPEIPNDVDMPY